MKVIDRTKAVTQHFLENFFKKLSITRNVFKKDKRRRIKKEENITQARLSTCT